VVDNLCSHAGAREGERMQDRRTRRRRVYVFVFIVILFAALYLLLQPRQTTAQALDASVTHAWVA